MTDYTPPDPLRYFLIAWSILSALLAFSGNTVLLVASRKFHVFKIDQVTVLLIENLAVADLGYTVVGVIPTIGALIANKWVYGTLFCVINKVLTNIFFSMNFLLVPLLSLSKLIHLLYPTHVRISKTRHMLLIVALLWFLVVTYSVVSTGISKSEVYYDTASFQCWVNYRHKIPFGTILVGWVIVMNGVIIITTIWLFIEFKKASTFSDLKKSVTAIIGIAAVFTIATLPAAIVMIVKMGDVQMDGVTEAAWNIVTTYIFYISNFFNPAICYFSFRNFTLFVDRRVFKRDVSDDMVTSGIQIAYTNHEASM